jgi:hypothetical protein
VSMKPWLIGLASAVFLYAVPAPVQAQESRRYAEREAETPRLAEFKGGCPGPDGWTLLLMLPIILVVLPFYGLYKGGEALHDWICPPDQKKEEAPATPGKKGMSWAGAAACA